VLIVEDDEDLRRQFRTVLSYAGYDVHEAADGFSAVRQIDHSPPSIIVLDLGLPGLDGIAVLQDVAAQAHTRRIPVVVVTGRTGDLAHLDVPCVLRKPISPDELVNAVRECLATGAPSAGA
jgi:DNA-binding response OmpR family regulator